MKDNMDNSYPDNSYPADTYPTNTYPSNERAKNCHNSGNLPLSGNGKNRSSEPAEPLPESSRPRKDGPGGD